MWLRKNTTEPGIPHHNFEHTYRNIVYISKLWISRLNPPFNPTIGNIVGNSYAQICLATDMRLTCWPVSSVRNSYEPYNACL